MGKPADRSTLRKQAFGILFTKVSSRYGGRSAPQRQKHMESDVGMEPLKGASYSSRQRGYSGASEFDDHPSPPEEGLYQPAMPQSAQDPAPAGRVRTFRADGLRPSEYQPLTRSRDPSPSGIGEQHPRPMV